MVVSDFKNAFKIGFNKTREVVEAVAIFKLHA